MELPNGCLNRTSISLYTGNEAGISAPSPLRRSDADPYIERSNTPIDMHSHRAYANFNNRNFFCCYFLNILMGRYLH